jgi:hypothetical protein
MLELSECQTGDRLVLQDGTHARVVGVNAEAGYIWLSDRARMDCARFAGLGAMREAGANGRT